MRILLLAVLLPILTSCDQAKAPDISVGAAEFVIPEISRVESSSTAPVRIVASKQRFVIPRNYLHQASISEGKAFFEIVTFFPEMDGATENNLSKFRQKDSFKYPERLQIDRLAYLSSIVRKAEMPRLFPGDFSDGEISEVAAGKEKFLYLRISEGDSGVVAASCDDGVVKFRLCSVLFDYAPGVVIRYEFHASLFPRWIEIHRKIISLLDSFRQNVGA